jgi:hypothetical protein
VPHAHQRRHHDDLDRDLAECLRELDRPRVETIVSIADPAEASELRVRQRAAIVRLLRQAVELRRVT